MEFSPVDREPLCTNCADSMYQEDCSLCGNCLREEMNVGCGGGGHLCEECAKKIK